MSESGQSASLEPGSQVLVSTAHGTNVVSYLPSTTAFAVIVAIRSTPTEIEAALRGQDIDPAGAVVIPVGLDDPSYAGPIEVTGVVRPSDLGRLGRVISERLEAPAASPGWLVIDDLVVLLMYSGDQRVVRFLQAIAGRVRTGNSKAIYGLERAAVSPETFDRLRATCEFHVDLTAD